MLDSRKFSASNATFYIGIIGQAFDIDTTSSNDIDSNFYGLDINLNKYIQWTQFSHFYEADSTYTIYPNITNVGNISKLVLQTYEGDAVIIDEIHVDDKSFILSSFAEVGGRSVENDFHSNGSCMYSVIDMITYDITKVEISSSCPFDPNANFTFTINNNNNNNNSVQINNSSISTFSVSGTTAANTDDTMMSNSDSNSSSITTNISTNINININISDLYITTAAATGNVDNVNDVSNNSASCTCCNSGTYTISSTDTATNTDDSNQDSNNGLLKIEDSVVFVAILVLVALVFLFVCIIMGVVICRQKAEIKKLQGKIRLLASKNKYARANGDNNYNYNYNYNNMNNMNQKYNDKANNLKKHKEGKIEKVKSASSLKSDSIDSIGINVNYNKQRAIAQNNVHVPSRSSSNSASSRSKCDLNAKDDYNSAMVKGINIISNYTKTGGGGRGDNGFIYTGRNTKTKKSSGNINNINNINININDDMHGDVNVDIAGDLLPDLIHHLEPRIGAAKSVSMTSLSTRSEGNDGQQVSDK